MEEQEKDNESMGGGRIWPSGVPLMISQDLLLKKRAYRRLAEVEKMRNHAGQLICNNGHKKNQRGMKERTYQKLGELVGVVCVLDQVAARDGAGVNQLRGDEDACRCHQLNNTSVIDCNHNIDRL